MIIECQHNKLLFFAVIEDIVIYLQILLSERDSKFVHHQTSIEVLLNDSETAGFVGEIEE